MLFAYRHDAAVGRCSTSSRKGVWSTADTACALWDSVLVDTGTTRQMLCHRCDQVTDHYLGDVTTVDGDKSIVIEWWVCGNCGAENLR